ncbi:MAG: HD domain-containing protein [Leptospiraceae bacterium]|nr:HD domain-containing protein [Leptospiraceae bacterium]
MFQESTITEINLRLDAPEKLLLEAELEYRKKIYALAPDQLNEDQSRESDPLRLTIPDCKFDELHFTEQVLWQASTIKISTNKRFGKWLVQIENLIIRRVDNVSENPMLTQMAEKIQSALQCAWLLARFPEAEIYSSLSKELDFTDFPLENAEQLLASAPLNLRSNSFRAIICARKPSRGLRFLEQTGLLRFFLPELCAGKNLSQNRFHAYDIQEHLLRALDGAVDLDEAVRWSALLHDIGKVPTRVVKPDGEASFHNHEMYSARMVVPIMKRLGIHRELGQKIRFLVRNHMFHYTDEWSDKAVRRFVNRVSGEELDQLISLRLADRKGSGKKTAFPRGLQKLMNHIDAIKEEESKLKVKDLAVGGFELMREFSLQPGPLFGDILDHLLIQVVESRLVNSRDELLQEIESYLRRNQIAFERRKQLQEVELGQEKSI